MRFSLGLLVVIMLASCQSVPTSEPELTRAYVPLDGEEILFEARSESRAFVTARKELRLNYRVDREEIPEVVYFLYRPHGQSEWASGPAWVPGREAPLWTVPGEGQYEIVAVPRSQADSQQSESRFPKVRLIVDWTPPEVRPGDALPREPLRGGDELGVHWSTQDQFLGYERVELEFSHGIGGSWEKIAEVPNTGSYFWKVPNRPMAGAKIRLTVTDAAGNSSTFLFPGSLTVSSQSPAVVQEAELTSAQRLVAIPYDATSADPEKRLTSPLRQVELWVTGDRGDSWDLVGYDHDLTSPFEHEFKEGEWGYQIVLVDDDGNRSAVPVNGDRPQSRILIDSTPPECVWRQPTVRRFNSAPNQLEIRVPFQIDDESLDIRSIQGSYESQGGGWLDAEGVYRADGELVVRRSVHAREPLRVQLSGHDRASNGFVKTLEIWPSELLNPPKLELTQAPSGWLPAGQEVILGYRCEWESLGDSAVDLDYSLDGKTWIPIATGLEAQGAERWRVPSENSSDLKLRVTARSSDGREKYAYNESPFGVDVDAPTAQVVSPYRGYGDPVKIFVEGQDTGGSGVASLELYFRQRGSTTWQLASRREVASGVLDFRPQSKGAYELWPVAVDHAGNQSRSPELAGTSEPFVFTAEEVPPGVRLLAFQNGGVYAGGTQHPIFIDWSGALPLGGVIRVEYSDDNGTSWRLVNTMPIGEEKLFWTLPDRNIESCRVRLVAEDMTGHETRDQSRTPFAIDATAPSIQLTTAEPIAEGKTRVHYAVDDEGGSSVKLIHLYLSRDQGTTWAKLPEPFPHLGFLDVDLKTGVYSFFARGEDTAGNLGPAPRPGQAPDLTYEVGSVYRAEIVLKAPQQGVYPGGSRHYIFWELKRVGVPFPDFPVSIEMRGQDDEDWTLIARDQLASGQFPWYVPEQDGFEFKLRVTAQDLEGRFYADESEGWIVVDSRVPEVAFVGPSISTQRLSVIEYQHEDDEEIETVELWVRAVSTPNWRLIAKEKATGSLTVELADGQYWVKLVGIDRAGNRGPEPHAGEPSRYKVLVDTVAPVLVIDGVHSDESPGRQSVFREGDTVVLKPRVEDHYLGEFPISARMSVPGRENFRVLREYHPNGADLAVKLPRVPGLHYVEVIARDLAGNETRETVEFMVIPTPPTVRLLTDPAGSIVRSGSSVRLEWESRGIDPLHRGLSIEFTTDGETWKPLARELPADGVYTWVLPAVDSNRVQLRFALEREDGLVGRAWSGAFTISTTPPKSRVNNVTPK